MPKLAKRQITRLAKRIRSHVVEAICRAAIARGVVRHLSRFHAVDHLVKLVAQVLANLLAHASSPTRNTARVVLVDVSECRRIGETLETGFVRMKHRESRH